MQADGVPDDPRGVKHPLEILHDDENDRDPKRVPPVAPLRGRDQDGGNPANDDAEIGDHRQGNDQQTDKRGEVQTEKGQRGADEEAVDQTDA